MAAHDTPDMIAAEERASARAWYALAVLSISMVFGYIDARILVLLAQWIKQDLSLSDYQIGETHGLTPAIFTALAMGPLAWLADRFERRTILFGCVIFWSLATAASGLATSFPTLLACSIAIVVGEAGLTPIVYSLIPDLFPPKSRPRANIIAYGATVLGAGLGTSLGGAMIHLAAYLRPILPSSLQSFETWRLTFFLVALPGPLVALAVFLIGRTQRQAAVATESSPMMPMGPYVKEHGLVAFGTFGTMACLAFGLMAISNWLPVALIRTFHADAGSVGIGFGLSFTAGAGVALIIAAMITPYLRRAAGSAYVLRALTYSAAGGVLPTLLLGFTTEVWQAYALVFVWAMSVITGVSLMPGMMQDVAPAALRARVIAAGTVLFMCVGYLSPPLVGFVSDQMLGNAKGLMWGMIAIAVVGCLACAILSRIMEAPFRRTVAAIAAA